MRVVENHTMSEIKETKKLPDNSIRCVSCDKLLAKDFFGGSLEIKCNRCGTINVIFEQVTDQVMITDPEGKIVYINKVTEKETGFTTKEVIGKKPSDLWGNQMPPEFYKQMWRAIKGEKKSFQTVLSNKRKDGKFYEVKLVISPIFDTNGAILFYVGTESKLKKKE